MTDTIHPKATARGQFLRGTGVTAAAAPLRRALPAAATFPAAAPGALPHRRGRAAGPGQQEVSDGSEAGAGRGWDGGVGIVG